MKRSKPPQAIHKSKKVTPRATRLEQLAHHEISKFYFFLWLHFFLQRLLLFAAVAFCTRALPQVSLRRSRDAAKTLLSNPVLEVFLEMFLSHLMASSIVSVKQLVCRVFSRCLTAVSNWWLQ